MVKNTGNPKNRSVKSTPSKTASARKSTKRSTKKTALSTTKRISFTIDKELLAQLDAYVAETGISRDLFINKAIHEKIRQDKISTMIDHLVF